LRVLIVLTRRWLDLLQQLAGAADGAVADANRHLHRFFNRSSGSGANRTGGACAAQAGSFAAAVPDAGGRRPTFPAVRS
jgi:hypothetical protein